MAEVFLAETRAAPLRQQLWLQAAGLGVLWLLLRAAACPSPKPGTRLERALLAAGLCLALGQAIYKGWRFYGDAMGSALPYGVFAGLAALIAFYGAMVRPRAVARTAPLILLGGGLALAALTAALWNRADLRRLLEDPALTAEGWQDGLWQTLALLPEMPLLAWLGRDAEQQRRDVNWYILGLGAARWWILLLQGLVLGSGQLDRPLHRLSALGQLSVFTRLDGLFVLVWLTLFYGRCLLYGSCLARLARSGAGRAVCAGIVSATAVGLYLGVSRQWLPAAGQCLLWACLVWMLAKRRPGAKGEQDEA
mgnify:FL=1